MTSIARPRFASILSAGLLALAACGGPAPAAPAAPAPEAPVVAAAPAATDPCDPLRVTIGPGATDRAALDAALATCPDGSNATITVDGDVSYQQLVDVMDVMSAHRHAIGIDAPELPALPTLSALPAPADLAAEGELRRTPVIIVSTAAVTLRAGDTLHNLASGPALDDAGVRKLYDALVALRTAQPELPGTLVLQADRTTRSLTLQRVIAGARAAGFTGVLFAVKKS